jgi:hypothetical protein
MEWWAVARHGKAWIKHKKRSNRMRVYKYQIPLEHEFLLILPENAEILTVVRQGPAFFIYALVNADLDFPKEERNFALRGTSKEIDVPVKYIGTFNRLDSKQAYHLFEKFK